MSASRSHRPSPGFVLIVLVHVLILAFLFWSLSTPDLDRVWTLHHLLKIGKLSKLKREDRRVLNESMARHEKLARDLLDGRAVGLISANDDGWIATPNAVAVRCADAGEQRKLVLDVQTPRDLFPFKIILRGPGWKKKLKIAKRQVLKVDLPDPGAHGEVLEIRVQGKAFKADPSMLAIRVGFEEAS